MAPGQAAGKATPQPVPATSPESGPAVEPAPPMVVKPKASIQEKITSAQRRSAPAPSLPRSKTTIISSVAPSGEEPAIESAPSTGEAPPQCAPTPHRYNIEVSAVNEKSEAAAMVGRIAELGYKACVKTRTVNGQTQYAVRIGPYNTEDEAAAAQEKLHEQYKAAYSEP